MNIWRTSGAPKGFGMDFRWTCPELQERLHQWMGDNDPCTNGSEPLLFRLASAAHCEPTPEAPLDSHGHSPLPPDIQDPIAD